MKYIVVARALDRHSYHDRYATASQSRFAPGWSVNVSLAHKYTDKAQAEEAAAKANADDHMNAGNHHPYTVEEYT